MNFGHMLAGILLGFKPRSLEIMPVGLAIGFESKLENYNKKVGKTNLLTIKKIIIAMVGPITNIVFIILFTIHNISFAQVQKEVLIYANILLAIFNLLPIYPLDGGRIIKGIFCIACGKKKADTYINKISNICIIFLTAISSIGILYFKNAAILLILVYLWFLVIRENKKYENKKKIYEKIEILYNQKTNKRKVAIK